MRALKPANGVIPRGFADHRTTVARRYREYCETVQAAWGPLPQVALRTLREAGLTAMTLDQLGADLEQVGNRNRRKAAQIRREQFKFREQLARLESRLKENAAPRRVDPLREVRRAVAEANR